MSDTVPALSAKKRDRLGSRYTQRLRAQGGMPAILYGHGEQPQPLTLDAKETIEHLEKGEKVFELNIEDGGTETVLVRELQFDHLGTDIIHADLSRVDLTERVHTRAHVQLIGDAKGLKASGAILMHPVTELDIECQVTNIPEHVEVDISGLEVGESIYVKDVVLPKPTMVMLSDPDGVVANIVIQGHVETAEESAAGGAAAPEVITEKKDTEEG
ncbi:MAG: 50S ribosomal protein L25 [Planctomycetota bacterium]